MRHESLFYGMPVSKVIQLIERENSLSNHRRLLPLRKYEVSYIISINQRDVERSDTFTADMHRVDEGRNQFLNTGNVIREYQMPLVRIIATPLDDDTQIPE